MRINTVHPGGNFTEQRPFWFLFLEELYALHTVLRLVTLFWQNVAKKGTNLFKPSIENNASVNSSCAHPPPRATGGGALANLAWSGGRAFAYPRAFDTHVVSNSKSKHEGFMRKEQQFSQIGSSVKVKDWTNLRRFSWFYAFLHCLSRHNLKYRYI